MNNKTFFLLKISVLFAATHILLSSCATTPAVTSSSSSSISTLTETTDKSTTTPIAQESKYKVQIKNQNEIIESITPAVFFDRISD
jgi:starvation-inducible outer membrane lipoprotein